MGKIIYIAGKYHEPTYGARLANTHKMIDCGIQLYESSNHHLVPYVPTWTHWMEERMDYLRLPSRPNEWWYEFDNNFLPKCDGLIKISKDGVSKGADLEENLARSLEIPVFYSVEECIHHFYPEILKLNK